MKVKTKSIILEGFDEISEVIMRLKLEKKTLPACDVKIDMSQEIHEGRCDYTWYGGLIAMVSCMDSEYRIMANGDVIATLYDKDTDEEAAYVKDKGNNGEFYGAMCPYIENDAHLYEIIEDNDPKYRLAFSNNNWFEVFRDKISGAYGGNCYVSECTNVFDVLAETVETILYDYKGCLEVK